MKNETSNKSECVRPLAREVARELTAEEIAQVGAGCTLPYSKSGCNPIQTGDWDVNQ